MGDPFEPIYHASGIAHNHDNFCDILFLIPLQLLLAIFAKAVFQLCDTPTPIANRQAIRADHAIRFGTIPVIRTGFLFIRAALAVD